MYRRLPRPKGYKCTTGDILVVFQKHSCILSCFNCSIRLRPVNSIYRSVLGINTWYSILEPREGIIGQSSGLAVVVQPKPLMVWSKIFLRDTFVVS